MQINRKLSEREQKLLQVLANEKKKTLADMSHLMSADDHDMKTIIDSAMDRVDLSSLDENKETDWTLVKTYNQRLKDIEEAIDSLARGQYGFCQECGRPIAEKRLEAMPFTLYCVNCRKGKELME